MYSLPSFLSARFNLYINVLPSVETGAICLLFIAGVFFIGLSLYRLYQMKNRWTVQNRVGTQWLDEDLNDKNLEFLRVENRKDMTSKELEVYYSSLITPINQDLSFQEFNELKEEML